MPLVTGTSTVLLTPAGYRNPIVISNIWTLVERFRPTVLVMVPTSWGAALNVPVDGHDISSVILCQSGGAAMPVALAEAVESRLKVPFAEGWGMTEVHGFGSMNPVGEEGRIGSVGLRTPFTEIIAAHVASGRSNCSTHPSTCKRLISNQKTEAKIACNALNKMTGLGMPISVRIK
jgi:fatty-acyl-CoA synthase